MSASANLVGTNLAGRYDVLELLGSGGMGAVYRVLDRELDELVALKVIRSDLADDREMIERFRSEVRLARRVTHANVARTFELGRSGDTLYCTMELVEGESLAAHLRRRGRLALPEAATIATAVCDAAIAAHAAGVIHRDIKPQNILLATNGRIVVTDFGIASLAIDDAGIEGTPPYMAPEQLLGAPPAPAIDVYAIGVVFYEMLVGEPAFGGELAAILAAKQAREHVDASSVGPGAAALIARATMRDVSARIASAIALRDELAVWAQARPQPAAVEARALRQHANVVVSPPRGDPANLYVAEGVHAELLQRLARTPWVRVHTTTPAGVVPTVVELAVDGELAISVIRPGASPLVLRAPLALEHLGAVAESAAAAVTTALAAQSVPPSALDLVLRARHAAQTSVGRLASGVELLEQAARIAPESALVAATLAIAKLQRAFFASADETAMLDHAAQLVRMALAHAPELFETHMAAGHLELHRGDPALAALHFRSAIACAPHSAAAHEQLGRMLLEAGHLDRGFARLTDALAIAPDLRSARWEMARARALQGDWSEHDRLVGEAPGGNLLGQLRFMTWRGRAYAEQLRASTFPPDLFERDLVAAILAVLCDDAWSRERDRMLATALQSQRPSRRRRAFVAQLVAEAAGVGGDADACELAIAYAIDHGLFDLHWLDACLPLAVVRTRPRFPTLRAAVERRSLAILDALYGDRAPVAFDATALGD